jgi:hypothetical protein
MEIYLELLADKKPFEPTQQPNKKTEVCFEEFMIFLDGCQDLIEKILKLYLKSFSIQRDHYGCFYIKVNEQLPDNIYSELLDLDTKTSVTKDPFNLSFALNNSKEISEISLRLKKYFTHNNYVFAQGVAKL